MTSLLRLPHLQNYARSCRRIVALHLRLLHIYFLLGLIVVKSQKSQNARGVIEIVKRIGLKSEYGYRTGLRSTSTGSGQWRSRLFSPRVTRHPNVRAQHTRGTVGPGRPVSLPIVAPPKFSSTKVHVRTYVCIVLYVCCVYTLVCILFLRTRSRNQTRAMCMMTEGAQGDRGCSV